MKHMFMEIIVYVVLSLGFVAPNFLNVNSTQLVALQEGKHHLCLFNLR